MMHRTLTVAFSLCLAATSAKAAEPAPRDPDVARASALLEQASENGHANRMSALVVGATSIAVLAPTGVVLLVRGGDVPHIIGTGLTATAGGALLTTFLSLHSTPAEQLYDSFQTWRASGIPEAELLHRTETEWSKVAQSSASRRGTLGTIETVFGGALAVSGAIFLLVPPAFGLSPRQEYSLGAILAGSGIPIVSIGIHTLFVKTPAEVSWQAYRAGKPDASTPAKLDVGVTSVAGGGALVATGTF